MVYRKHSKTTLMLILTGLVVGGASSLLTGPAHADVIYDVAAQFDPDNNPSSLGPWRYGSQTALGGPLTLFGQGVSFEQVEVWNSAANGANVNRNFSPDPYAPANHTVRLLGGQAMFHPGSNGELAVFRFTAPSDGFYDISASFSGNDTFLTTTDVHVLVNDVSIFDGLVNSRWTDPSTPGAGPSFSTSSPLSLLADATIDFAVGYGTNNSWSNDATGIDAFVTLRESTAVPEPASITMLGMGCVCLAAGAVRRRRKAERLRLAVEDVLKLQRQRD